jgi:RNA-directed DNA polymerase
MEQVVESQNLRTAYGRVKANAGSPGIDKMMVEDFQGYRNEYWAGIKVQLLEGTYKPHPVRRVLDGLSG